LFQFQGIFKKELPIFKQFACFTLSCPQGTSTTQSVTASLVTVTRRSAEPLQRAQVKFAEKRDPINKFKILSVGFWELIVISRIIEWKDQGRGSLNGNLV